VTPGPADPQTVREVEHKLRVHGLFELPDLTAAGCGVARVEPLPRLRLTAAYFDTADLRLARHHVTLRRRDGGLDDGWHLKLPVDDATPAKSASDPASRDELQLPLSAAPADGPPPHELLELVLGLTRTATVEPVTTLRNERRPSQLFDADGLLLAELTDDSVAVVDGGHVTARFRELEIERRAGSPKALAAVVAALEAAGAVAAGDVSKAARALGPAAAAPPDVPEPGPVRPKDPAADAVTAHLARHVRAFQAQDLRVRRGLPDSVHQMRVAARRLRSGLKVFSPLVEEHWADALRSELAWIAGVLGGVRDREVLEARLLAHAAELGGPDGEAAGGAIRRILDAEVGPARAAVDEAMVAKRYLALLDVLVDAVHFPRLTKAAQAKSSQALPPLVHRTWRRLASDVQQLRLDSPDVEWHAARIAAKKARYATEALVPVFGEPAKTLARQLESVTELLGDHHDAVIAADTLRRFAGTRGISGRAGFALGRLHDVERAHAAELLVQFERTWPEVSRKRYRAWLEP